VADALVYLGGAIVAFWGLAHTLPVKAVVAGFHLTSVDNRRILTMEWLAEAVSLVFLGALVVIVTATGGSSVALVQRSVATVLFAMAGLHALLGARTAVRPMQICPVVLGVSGALVLAGSLTT
jgi:hypothetical protein